MAEEVWQVMASCELVIGFAYEGAETEEAGLSYDWRRYRWRRSLEKVQRLVTESEEWADDGWVAGDVFDHRAVCAAHVHVLVLVLVLVVVGLFHAALVVAVVAVVAAAAVVDDDDAAVAGDAVAVGAVEDAGAESLGTR